MKTIDRDQLLYELYALKYYENELFKDSDSEKRYMDYKSILKNTFESNIIEKSYNRYEKNSKGSFGERAVLYGLWDEGIPNEYYEIVSYVVKYIEYLELIEKKKDELFNSNYKFIELLSFLDEIEDIDLSGDFKRFERFKELSYDFLQIFAKLLDLKEHDVDFKHGNIETPSEAILEGMWENGKGIYIIISQTFPRFIYGRTKSKGDRSGVVHSLDTERSYLEEMVENLLGMVDIK